MNATQEKTIEAIKEAMLKKESLGGLANVEVKYSHVEDAKSFTSFVLEVGRVGDEGTMAEVFCRDRRHFFVGKKGGVSLVSVDKSGKLKTFGYKKLTGLFNSTHALPF